jgi:hypothetical protein
MEADNRHIHEESPIGPNIGDPAQPSVLINEVLSHDKWWGVESIGDNNPAQVSPPPDLGFSAVPEFNIYKQVSSGVSFFLSLSAKFSYLRKQRY